MDVQDIHTKILDFHFICFPLKAMISWTFTTAASINAHSQSRWLMATSNPAPTPPS
jgi:hypothetical protein